MSISDTRDAKKYASIAEVAAAQCKQYTDDARNAPQYAGEAKASADASAVSAGQSSASSQLSFQSATSASNSASAALTSANNAAASAATAGSAAAAAVQGIYDNLASSDVDKGSSLIGIGNDRTQADFNSQFISPENYYSGTGSWDSAISQALAASKFISFETGKTYSVNEIPLFDGHALKGVDVTISVAAGVHNYTSPIYVKGTIGNGIKITTPTSSNISGTTVSVTGTAKQYVVEFNLSDVSTINVGDFVLCRTITDSGDGRWVTGVWRVSTKGVSSISVINTCHNASPPSTSGISVTSVKRLSAVFNFAGCNGLKLDSAQMSLDGSQVWVGDWDVNLSTGTTGAHAMVVSAPDIVGGASSNASVVGQGSITTGVDVCIYGWGEQGIAAEQSAAMSINFLISCANRKRGIYVSTCVGARGKFTITNGNGEDGVIADENGGGSFSNSISCGNGLNGFWATNGGYINAASSYAIANNGIGFESRGFGKIACELSVASYNLLQGFAASNGGMLDASTAIARSNVSDGFYLFNGGHIRALNAGAVNNGGWGVNSIYSDINFTGSGAFTGNASGSFNTIGTRGFVNNAKSPFLYDQTFGTSAGAKVRISSSSSGYGELVATSVGDVVVSNNGTNSFIMKSQGAFHPATDNATAQTNGRSTERWASSYSVRYLFTSTVGMFYGAGSPEGGLTAGIGSTYHRTDGAASTSYYVKESGTGNTGWVAK